MLGFLRGIQSGTAREAQAKRDHQAEMLAGRDTHMQRLMEQIRYNKDMSFREKRAKRSDFESDRLHGFNVDQAEAAELRWDVEQKFRQKVHADTNKQWLDNYLLRKRASDQNTEAHRFLYGEGGVGGYKRQQAANEQTVFDWNYGPDGYMQERRRQEGDRHKWAGEEHNFNFGEGGYRTTQRDYLQEQLSNYRANAPLRELEREYKMKLGADMVGDGWLDFLDRRSDDDRLREANITLKEAQAKALLQPRTSRSGTAPTWLQARGITVEELAPVLADFLGKGSREWDFMDFSKFEWDLNPFKRDLPYASTDPKQLTQKTLMRQAGANLIETMVKQGVDPTLAMQMIAPTVEAMLLTDEGQKFFSRLQKGMGGDEAGMNALEFRREIDKFIQQGAMSFMLYGDYQPPEGKPFPGQADVDKILDMELPE